MAFTITGGVSLSGVSYMPPPPPPLPGSLLFNTTKYLTLPSSDNFTFTGDFTIECWIYVPSISNTIQRIFSSNAGPGGACYFSVGNDIGTGAGAGKLCANGHLVSPYTAGFITASTAIPINTWIHVALVRNGSTITIYQNGVSVASATDSATWDFNNSAGVRISGTPWAGSSEDFGGYITNFRAVKGTAVYTGNFTPSTSPLTAIANTSLLLNAFQGADFLKDTSTNNFTVTNNNGVTSSNVSPVTVEYLVVAGGGAGGGGQGTGGGGGAGGLLTASGFAISTGTPYTITVGAGGAGISNNRGNAGFDSVFSSVTATGGGGAGGGGSPTTTGGNGGSGGGGAEVSTTSYPGGTGTNGQGNNGGASLANGTTQIRGGGGGGASAAGATGTASGNGGAGTTSSISGSNVAYAGGGGGGAYYSGTAGTGGSGGGGNGLGGGGATGTNTAGSNNTGGGGGGVASPTNTSSSGGSGIVIIRYPDTYATATSTTGSPNVIYANANIIYRFWQSGTITF